MNTSSTKTVLFHNAWSYDQSGIQVGRNEEAKQMIKWALEIPITFRSEEKEHAEIEQIVASL